MRSHDKSHDRHQGRHLATQRKSLREKKWALQDLNLRPTDYESEHGVGPLGTIPSYTGPFVQLRPSIRGHLGRFIPMCSHRLSHCLAKRDIQKDDFTLGG